MSSQLKKLLPRRSSITRHNKYSLKNMTASCEKRNLEKCLTIDNMNQCVRTMPFVVRGPLYERAKEIERELQEGQRKSFERVLPLSYGDCHWMGQPSLTFVRQVLAAACYTPLLESPSFPPDVKAKVKMLLSECRGGSVGAYADPGGVKIVRKHCAEFITKRDGVASDWNDITICGGASDAIKGIMKLFLNIENGKKTGFLMPIPQYPFYMSTSSELGIGQVCYCLDENDNWSLNIDELKRAINEGRKKYNVKAIIVINPGNPTGQVLSRKNIEEIIKFAYEENICIFADEVYQENVFGTDSKFYSFKKVMTELGAPYNGMQLASFNSCSKGFLGECGLRGGYAEFINISPKVRAMYLKSIAAALCPSVLGQIAVDCLVKPPVEGEPSYALWKSERDAILDSLRKRASVVANGFRDMEGISCSAVQGAMYLFPRIRLHKSAVIEAKKRGLQPDEYYALELLENTGICVTPGSLFFQKEGTYHFRITILPHIKLLESMFDGFKSFHTKFMEEHSAPDEMK